MIPVPDAVDLEIVSTRLLSTPRQEVFKAFSDPGHLMHWWGPKGFANSFHEFDFRTGGLWRFTMHGPDGTSYRNETEFVDVSVPDRIVFRHLKPAHRFLMTMTFAEEGRKTRLVWRMLFESAAEYAKIKNFIPDANEQNFDRLEKHLAKMVS